VVSTCGTAASRKSGVLTSGPSEMSDASDTIKSALGGDESPSARKTIAGGDCSQGLNTLKDSLGSGKALLGSKGQSSIASKGRVSV
jgi:hypothetical protein